LPPNLIATTGPDALSGSPIAKRDAGLVQRSLVRRGSTERRIVAHVGIRMFSTWCAQTMAPIPC
jgi:hypothetical protein